MAETETWTVGRLLQWTAEYLGRHGSESPRLEAEVLLAEALGCQRIQLYTSYDTVPSDEIRTRFRDLVRRRAEGMPVAYLVGRREFYSLTFKVTPDVLIPRPETEFLVIGLLDLAKQRPADQPVAVCDVGTGSGIIAVSVAKYLPSAQVTAVDISPAALAVARGNAATHGVEARIEFVQADLLATLPAEAQFDFVASNPPYVRESEYEALAPDVKKYEPRGALVAGPKGTEIIERLIPLAAERLKSGGYLLMEISPMIHDDVQARIAADARLEPMPTVKDLAQLPRVVQARKK
ncbi:MAG: peptide chain release factor N(5)-glutamine methyltransferase [Thermoguttaceae bacterium]